jgi:GH24 family phage-related lysozyme (muramidase)
MITSISQNGINFIKRCEGFRPKVYNDNGKPAIAYGHDLLPGESFPNGIDEAGGTVLLAKDAAKLYPTINKMAPQANQNQFDACCSFGYNLGDGDLVKMLSHGLKWAPVKMPLYHYKSVGGKMVSDPSLVARRAEEVKLFKS